MNFSLCEEKESIRATLRDVAQAGSEPDIGTLAELGLFGIMAPEELGGVELGLVDLCLCAEELATTYPSVARTVQAHNLLCLEALLVAGTPEQKERFAPGLCTGEKLGSAGRMRDGAVRRVPNGRRADVVVAFDQRGAVVGTGFCPAGEPPRQMGMRSSEPVDLLADGADLENLPGDVGKALAAGDVGLAAIQVGIARAALEAGCRYAGERVQFGRPIAEFQAIRWKLADAATALEAARLMVHRAAFRRDAGRPFFRQAEMALVAANRAALLATDHAVQIHGGYGYVTEFPVEHLYRDARACALTDGTMDERLDRIAASMLEGVQP